MKKTLQLIVLYIFMATSIMAQVIVGTDPMPKNAILEEFTGIHCVYCPQGHVIAQGILDNNPGRAFTIAIHQGSFAVPGAGEPDFRTIFGNAIAGQTGLTGYPSGTVNRHVFSGANTILGRGSWVAACNIIMQQTSPVNIGLTSDYDPFTRRLTINVELYYTSDGLASTNNLNIALIQDSIYGPQTGGNAGNNYLHMHMLRHLITGQWGELVSPTTAGSFISRSYTYDVPEAYNNIPAIVQNMKVVAFVARDNQEILTGVGVDAIGGTNFDIGEMTSAEPTIKRGFDGFETNFTVEANSNIGGSQPFEIKLETESHPADWQTTFIIDGEEYTNLAVVNLIKDEPKPITVKVVPGNSPGFPTYTLKMKSVNYSSAPAKQIKVAAVAGVTDLVVNATGGPEAAMHQDVYLNALEASGITSYAVANADVMSDMVNFNAYHDVFNIWMNVAWTFPSLTDGQAEALMTFMDAGHNVFIAGQDIGWDIMSGVSGSNGTPVTQDFYTNYLKAIYVADGSSVNNKLTANPDDQIFGQVAQSNIVDVYGGNMYPDEINAGAGADIIFHYNTNAKNAAIRYESDTYRSIYFGIGLEMLSNIEIANEVIGLSRLWLTDLMVGVEYEQAMKTLMSDQNYPNPAGDFTYIKTTEAAMGGYIEIYNLSGGRVVNQAIGNSLLNRVDLSELSNGMYTYRIISGSNVSEAKKLTIIR
ncbi:MAG: Omp28-related outer membrane protein [Lentimicrobium sp.]|nr:Omp28-related outer membrane protein [Lentimicrobium sp.]